MRFLPGLGALLVTVLGAGPALSVITARADASLLVSASGDTAIIPGWNLQSITKVSDDMPTLSQPGVDVSSWYRVGARGTVMAGLIENGVYNETELWFSDNMESETDRSLFEAPWYYREEFSASPSAQHFFLLKTNGITSKADIYMNGLKVASSDQQQGSYGGHQYNVTEYIREGTNCVLIRAYPTNYLRDFAMGFVDWNPYPYDNGTGIWRHVELSQTGPVSMSPIRVLTNFIKPGDPHEQVIVTIRTDLHNWSAKEVRVVVNSTITADDDSSIPFSGSLVLQPHSHRTFALAAPIKKPKIWWPAEWGSQPLYTVTATTYVQEGGLAVSDRSGPQKFGIRHVTSDLNKFNDTAFSVNGAPFQVRGAGLGTDMFMRFDEQRVRRIFQYMLDMGLNTVRLEGKQEQPEMYNLADRMGMMILAGWECCDKWEGWKYNDEADGVKWDSKDYPIAKTQMLHEAEMMQAHPSMLGFLVGSDYWPDDRATKVYLEALEQMDWPNPIIASAAKRGYPEALGPSGMKMNGPYDWVPPNYWYGTKEGAAFGFGSELGAGVGTPELQSLKRFLSNEDLHMLWSEPDAGLYHMSSNVSQFYHRTIYNKALYSRYGKPSSLEDYLMKSQMADYEATRAEYEAYSANQNATRPATGLIYWMLNGAWPNLHWQLFDYYLSPMGAYFGTKIGARMEHVAYNYQDHTISLINHSLKQTGKRVIMVELIDINGKKISGARMTANTSPTSSKSIGTVTGIGKIKGVAFLRLILRDPKVRHDLSRNVYWLSPSTDVLAWSKSNWYYTPVTDYADYTTLDTLIPVTVKASLVATNSKPKDGMTHAEIQLENKAKVPAVFVRANAMDSSTGAEVAPVYWSDNYVTLWPKEKLRLTVAFEGELKNTVFEVTGKNVKKVAVKSTGSK
ncbi:hypothetical protein N7474_002262 [Penicillium riverlandense]|uniref:uncharacterized protein n=1 Tax=Penicillium riverlandense TaxID=1903569 RepID=UPI0025469845|nr:uncharacterized protein N7474_002262 [Penicillium riverlandense]KAJ5833951.1 hypothetical protein N7474_002262 [Penicillium riverlandense]